MLVYMELAYDFFVIDWGFWLSGLLVYFDDGLYFKMNLYLFFYMNVGGVMLYDVCVGLSYL